jgi:hypothetical protein
MTNLEMSNEFDIHYNSIAGQSAPNIDDYEKSVYLTKAQLEIVKNYYDSLSNRKQKGFESTEKRRVDLKELIVNYKTTNTLSLNIGLEANSKFFEIPNNTFLIIQETAKLSSTDNCINNTVSNIKSITHDEYNIQKKNPFKKPDKDTLWRLNISEHNNNQVVEIISPYDVSEYHMRYIKYPRPIILKDLDVIFPSENLSIDGFDTELECELNQSIHREIIDRAVELALRDYKPQGLESKIQLDQRNE